MLNGTNNKIRDIMRDMMYEIVSLMAQRKHKMS